MLGRYIAPDAAGRWNGMTDVEKVIKGIECCRRGFCFACPYNDGVDDNVDCKQILADDTLELLKRQREYEAAVEMEQYCEKYEPTYNSEDGSM